MGELVWSLKRHNMQEDVWDHMCPEWRQMIPIFVHAYLDAQGKLIFGYLRDKGAQKKL